MASRSRILSRCLAVLASSFVIATASPAFAEPSAADKETARSLMEDGDTKRDKGDLKGALKSYEAADAIMKVPTTGLEVAKAQAALGLLIEARDTLQRVVRIPAKPGEPAPFTAARKNAETLSNELAGRIPAVTINLTNVAPDTTPTVLIDDETIPAAVIGVPRKVNPGSHVIVVKANGGEKREELSIAEKETKTITIDLADLAGATAQVPETPPEASSSGGGAGKALMYAGFSLGVVGIGVGAVTGLMSISQTNELKDQCPNNVCPRDRQGDIDSAQSLGNISTIAFIAGGVGIGVGVVGLLMSGKDTKETGSTKPRVDPVVSGNYVGLRGTF